VVENGWEKVKMANLEVCRAVCIGSKARNRHPKVAELGFRDGRLTSMRRRVQNPP
jgi:hypothetical protein